MQWRRLSVIPLLRALTTELTNQCGVTITKAIAVTQIWSRFSKYRVRVIRTTVPLPVKSAHGAVGRPATSNVVGEWWKWNLEQNDSLATGTTNNDHYRR